MSEKEKSPGAKIFELRKRFVITQSCVSEAANALHEAGCETESEALAYAFSELRGLLEEHIPGLTPNNEPDPLYKNN